MGSPNDRLGGAACAAGDACELAGEGNRSSAACEYASAGARFGSVNRGGLSAGDEFTGALPKAFRVRPAHQSREITGKRLILGQQADTPILLPKAQI